MFNGFDLSTISAAYVGSQAVSEIWKGSTKIWPTSHDYSRDYLTTEFLYANDLSRYFVIEFQYNDIYYSRDNGTTWNILRQGNTITANQGDKILWKGPLQAGTGSFAGIGKFNIHWDYAGYVEKMFDVYGNIMSLLYGDNFIGQTDLLYTHAFSYLFHTDYATQYNNINNANNLILPATTLIESCYEGMFWNSAVITAPELPATTLAEWCYGHMFDTTCLTTAPELPATTLVSNCYYQMFYNGWAHTDIFLNYVKCLATDISAHNCTKDWLVGVAASGIFVKNASMSSWTTGTDGIPSGWTTQNA